MAPPLWDILEKASILVQLLGLDALTLVTIATSLAWLCAIKKECRKLEERVRMLQMLLCSPAGCWIVMTQQQHLELGDLATTALRDAQGLVASYNESTLFFRIRRGRSMVTQFQDLYNRIDYCCSLILTVNACLLVVQANPPPPSSVVRVEINDSDVSPSTGYSTDEEIPWAAPHDDHIIGASQE